MDVSLKTYLDKIYKVFDNIDKAGVGIHVFEPLLEFQSSKEVVQSDLTFYTLYLSASDGEITNEEREFIYRYLDVNFTKNEMKEIVIKKKLHSIEYETSIPLSVKMMIYADNKIVDAGKKDSNGGCIIYDLFKNIGQALITCDGDVDEKEIIDMSKYLELISDYINQESLSTRKLIVNPYNDSMDSKKLLQLNNQQIIRNDCKENETVIRQINEINILDKAPWDKMYYDYPCPFCGKSKARPSKWEDTMISTAFWGFYSYKLHCRFKCDYCGKMWN